MSTKSTSLEWRCHASQLLDRLMETNDNAILRIPVNIFKGMLYQVAERAAELNDPILNDLMVKMALYAVGDPMDPEFDPEVCRQIENRRKQFMAGES